MRNEQAANVLNHFGLNGWELVSVVQSPIAEDVHIAYMKKSMTFEEWKNNG